MLYLSPDQKNRRGKSSTSPKNSQIELCSYFVVGIEFSGRRDVRPMSTVTNYFLLHP